MNKQTKVKEEPRRVGPKFARNVIPEGFQIRRPASPMAELLNEASREREGNTTRPEEMPTPVKSTPVKSTTVILTPVENTAVDSTTVNLTTVKIVPDCQLSLFVLEGAAH